MNENFCDYENVKIRDSFGYLGFFSYHVLGRFNKLIMKKLIDKAALVAEIERRNVICKKVALDLRTQENKDYYQGKAEAYKEVLDILDTLEVKEVDINKEISQFIDTNFEKATIGHKLSLRRVAKHFFELGLKAQKGE